MIRTLIEDAEARVGRTGMALGQAQELLDETRSELSGIRSVNLRLGLVLGFIAGLMFALFLGWLVTP